MRIISFFFFAFEKKNIIYKLYNEDFFFFLMMKEILGIKFYEYFNVRYVMYTKILYYVDICVCIYIHYIIIISISVNRKIFKSSTNLITLNLSYFKNFFTRQDVTVKQP